MIALPIVTIWAFKFSDTKETERHKDFTKRMEEAVRKAVYDIYVDMKENEEV